MTPVSGGKQASSSRVSVPKWSLGEPVASLQLVRRLITAREQNTTNRRVVCLRNSHSTLYCKTGRAGKNETG